MTTFQAGLLSSARRHESVERRVSPALGGLATTLFAIGATFGLFLNTPAATATHVPGTDAWPAHLVISAALLTFLAGVIVTRGRIAVLAPISRMSAMRLRAAMSIRRARLGVVVPLVLLLAYLTFRLGMQATAGLDPAFTVNAWGGPSYVGALWCHFVDAVAIGSVAVAGLHLVLPRPRRLHE